MEVWPDPLLAGQKLALLRASMTLSGPGGMCFHRATAMVLDVPASCLCVGTLAPVSEREGINYDPNTKALATEPFLHAWVLFRGKFWAPTLIEQSGWRLVGHEPGVYMAVNKVTDMSVHPRIAVKKIAREHGFVPHLRSFRPLPGKARFADALLSGLGVPCRFTPEGFVKPGEPECLP